jgi:hypothetical protein
MEFLLLNLAGTLATLVGYLAIVFWHDVSGDS